MTSSSSTSSAFAQGDPDGARGPVRGFQINLQHIAFNGGLEFRQLAQRFAAVRVEFHLFAVVAFPQIGTGLAVQRVVVHGTVQPLVVFYSVIFVDHRQRSNAQVVKLLDLHFAAVFSPDSAADDCSHDPGIAIVFGTLHRVAVDLRADRHQEGAQAGEQGQQQQHENALDRTGGVVSDRLAHLSIFPPLSATLMEGIRFDARGS